MPSAPAAPRSQRLGVRLTRVLPSRPPTDSREGAAGCGPLPVRAPLPGEPCLMGCLESSIPSRKHPSTENRQHSATDTASLLPRRHTDDLAVYIPFISYSNVGEGHTHFHVASSSWKNKWEITDSNKNGNRRDNRPKCSTPLRGQ